MPLARKWNFPCIPHLGASIETREQLEEFFSKCPSPNVKLCLDTAHLAGADVNLVDLIHTYTGRINLLHFEQSNTSLCQPVGLDKIHYKMKRLFYIRELRQI